jgi:GNAT superfamily N-acetyltransferase
LSGGLRESGSDVLLRELGFEELARVAEIDRSEQISAIYVQRGASLELVEGDYSSPAWETLGEGEHSVAQKRRDLESLVARGAVAIGAFAGERLAGIGVVLPGLRPGGAQLAWLHVTRAQRAAGVGRRLAAALEAIARGRGDREMVVSATRSRSTVDFYMRLGFRPMADPLPELVELEPEDIHMSKALE